MFRALHLDQIFVEIVLSYRLLFGRTKRGRAILKALLHNIGMNQEAYGIFVNYSGLMIKRISWNY